MSRECLILEYIHASFTDKFFSLTASTGFGTTAFGAQTPAGGGLFGTGTANTAGGLFGQQSTNTFGQQQSSGGFSEQF